MVTLALTQGSGILGGTYQVAASLGVANFTAAGLNIDLIGTNKVLTAGARLAGSPVAVASNTFTIGHGAAVALSYTTQPTGAVAGQSLGTQPVLHVLDAAGNLVTSGADASTSVTLTLASTSPIYGTATLFAGAGVVTFAGLSSRTAQATESLLAAATLNGAPITLASNTFAITPAPASQLVFTTEPAASTQALVPFAQQPVVVIEDQYGNLVNAGADATATIALTLTGGTGTLSGTPTTSLTAVNGIADFSDALLSVDLVGSNKALTASKSDTTGSGGTAALSGTSSTFAITGGAAATLTFLTQPGGAATGSNLSPQPVLQVTDAAGNLVTTGPDATAAITLTLASGTGALLGTTSVVASAGIATFAGLHMQVVGAKTLTATKADTTGLGGTVAMQATSNSLTITAGAATQLVFVQPPGGATAGAIFAQQPVLQVQDIYGNLVTTGADSTVSVGVSLTSGAGPLQGTTPKTALGGVVSFTDLRIDTAGGGDVITAAATLLGGGTTVASTAFVVSPAAAVQLVFTTSPGGGTSSIAWATQPLVSIEDAYNNIITGGLDSTAVITLSLSQGTGLLGGSVQHAAVGGVADFTGLGLNIDLTGANKKLTASATLAGAPVSIVSGTFAITNGVATTLVFSAEPAAAVAGTNFAVQPVVHIQDAAGNLVTTGSDAGASLTLSLGSASTLYGSGSVLAVGGVATFAGLSSRTAIAAETLHAAATINGALATRVSDAFAVSPAAASQLVFTTQPSLSSASLTPFAQQPVVAIEDAYGNTVTAGPDATATITLTLSGGTGTLSGNPTTVLTAVGGVANFSSSQLQVDLAGANKVLTASKSDTSGGGGTAALTATSGTFAITGGAAASIAFATQPGGAVAGANLSPQPVLQILDAAGNLVTTGADASANVTLTLASGAGNLLGTATVAASSGVATFSGLSFQVTGAKTLTASKADTSGSGGTVAMHAVSNSFSITAGAATQLVFTIAPGGATAGANFAQQPQVSVQDAYGNLVTSGADSTVLVTLSLTSGTGPLQGTATRAAAAGVATFTNLEIDKSNSAAVLTAAAPLAGGATTTLSNAFAVAPAAASVLVFTTQPGGGVSSTAWATQPAVSIEDAYANVITTGLDSTAVVALALTTGSGTLSGTVQAAAVAGVASFAGAGLNIDFTGANKKLTATATIQGSPATVVSNTFAITFGAATQLAFSTQPSGAVAGSNLATQPVLRVLDAAGNLVTSGTDATANVTVSLGSASTLYGTATVMASGGVATFAGLSSHTSISQETLVASATLNSVPLAQTSSPFAITPAAASQVVFTTQPSASTVSLVPFARQPVVKIADVYGNVVAAGADATATITLTLSSGTGTLSGNPTTALQAVGGVADFSYAQLNIDATGANKVLLAAKSDTSGGGGTTALTGTSNTFAITQGSATSIAFASQPSAAAAGANLATQPVVQVLDAAGNLVTGGADANATVTLTLSSGTGAILGTASVAAVSGVATFAGIHFQVAGAKVLTASKSDTTAGGGTIATSAVSNSFTISPAAATQLVYASQPANAVAGAIFAQQPVIQVQDTYGNLVTTGADSTVSVALTLTTGSGALLGTTPKSALGGIATFTDLEIDVANSGAVLTAAATLLGGATTTASTAFAVSPGVAAVLVFATQPGGGVSNVAWATQPVVTIRDAHANIVTSGIDGAAVVRLTLSQGTGTLSTTTQVAATAGVATFSGLKMDLTGVNKKLTASATLHGSAVTVVSNVFSISNGVGTTLVFSTPPTGAVAGVNLGTQPVLQVRDAAGNLVVSGTDATASIALSLGSGSTLYGTGTLAASGGVATFAGLNSRTAMATETLTAAATLNGVAVTATSLSFAITPAAAAQVLFTRQPSASTASLVPFAQQPVVTIADPYGNAVSAGADATASITLTLSSGTGTLSGNPTTVLTASGGVADFTTALLSIDLTGTNKVLTATKSDTSGSGGTTAQTGTSNPFTITGGAASSLIFSAQPSGANAGANLGTQPVVQILDPAGNLVTTGADANATVSLTLASGTGALLGTASVSAVAGVATFAGLHLNIVGAKTLTASKTDTSSSGGTGATTVTSNSFTIGAASASQLVFGTQPGGATAGAIFVAQPVVMVQDPYGNLVASGADSTVSVALTLSLGTGPLQGTVSKTAIGGVATFTNLEIDKFNTAAVLTAATTITAGAVSVASSSFAVSPAAASVLVFTTQPGGGTSSAAWSTQPVVKIEDAYSNIITTGIDSAAVVSLTLSQGTGSLAGTKQAAGVAGVATFAGLNIDMSGTNKLLTAQATLNGAPVTVVSNTFTITNGVGTALVFSAQPTGSTAGLNFATQPVVQVLDAAGNLVTAGTDATASVVLTLGSASTLYGTATQAASGGVATFAALSSRTATQAETWVAAATLNGAPVTATSQAFAVTAAAASQVVFTTQPSASTASLVPFVSQPIVKIEDAFGNLVTSGADATATLTLTLSGGTGTLGGNPATALAATGGIANFAGAGLNIDLAGANKVLTATKSNTTGGGGTATLTGTSTTFAIVAGPLAQVVFTTQPGGANAGSNLGTQPVVTLEDAAGNAITAGADATANITLSVSSGTGTLSGTTTLAASLGVATFSGLSMPLSGAKVLTATKADTTGSGGTTVMSGVSSSFAISPASTTRLAFATQPGGGTAGAAWATQPVVQVLDTYGNLITTGADSTVTVTVSLTTGSGALAGTLSQVASGGVATFTTLQLNTANATANITAAATLSGGAATVVSSALTVVPAPASQMVFTTQPGGGVSATAWATQPVVTIKDTYGNITNVGSDGTAVVSLTLTQGTGALSGTALMAAVGGVADFTGKGLKIDLSGSNKQLTAQATLHGTPLTVVSGSFSVTSGVGTALAFHTPPGGAVAGTNFSPQPTVWVLDAAGNLVTSGTDATASITLTLGSSSALLGTATASAIGGAKTFAGLNSQTAVATETLVAAATLNGVSVTVTSPRFAVTSGLATQIVFTTQPSASTVALVPFAQQPVAKIEDAFGNPVTTGADSTATVTLALTTGTGTLAGVASTSMNAVGGVANFVGTKLNIDSTGTNKVITATKADTTASFGTAALTATTNAFTITNGSATTVAFATQPGGVTAGLVFNPQPVVNILDAAGNIVTSGPDATASVSMALTSGSGALAGVTSVAASSGVATFTTLQDNTAGTKVITATKADTTGSAGTVATSTTSSSFTIGVGSAAQLAFATQPANGTAGAALGQQPVVQVQDLYGNAVTTGADSTRSIALTLSAGNGALSGTTALLASGGNATFTTVQLNANNTAARITASTTITAGAVTVQSAAFTVVPTTATTLAFATQPGGGTSGVAWATQPVVQIRDSYSNVVTTGTDSTDPVTLSLTTGTGTLSGTQSKAAVAGVANFSGLALKINLVGANKVLTAKATLNGSQVTATSSAFAITNAAAATVVFATQPNTAVAGSVFGTQPVLNILDAAGNLVTTAPDATANVTVSINTGTGTLLGTTTVAASGGVATFTNVKDNTAQVNLSLTATKASTTGLGGVGVLAVNSNSFIVLAGPGTQLAYAVSPGTQTAGVTWVPAPVVTVMDAYNNAVISGIDSNATIVVSLTAGGGTAVGTLSVVASGGNAVFSSLSSGLYSVTNVLTASSTLSTGLASIASGAFTVNRGPATQLLFGTQPGGGTMGTVWATQPVVQVADANSNTIGVGSDSTIAVTVSLSSGNGSLGGTLSATASAGAATFSGLYSTQQGPKILLATATASSGPIYGNSNQFYVAPGNAFTADYAFGVGTQADYGLSNASSLALTGNSIVLAAASAADTNATNFAAGTMSGVQYDATNGYLRLGTTAGCDATVTNCAELDASWAPQYSKLTSYYKFNGTIGTIANGASITGALGPNLTAYNVNGTGMAYVAGKLNQAISFDGVDDYLLFSASPNSPAFTIAGWYKWADTTGTLNTSNIFSSRNNYGLFYFTPNYTGGAYTYVGTGINSDSITSNSAQVTQGSWRHFAVTLGEGVHQMYLDGLQVWPGANRSSGGYAMADIAQGPGAATYFGRDGNATYAYYKGQLDDVATWNAILSRGDIQALYTRQYPAYAGTFTSQAFDGLTANANWASVGWNTTLPFMKPLPNSLATETTTSYPNASVESAMETSAITLWRMDENAGTSGSCDFFDATGLSNCGTMNNWGYGTPAVFKSGFYFDNGTTSGYSKVPSSATSYSNPNTITLSSWFNTAGNTGGGILGFFSTQASSATNFDRGIHMRPNGQIVWWIYDTGASLQRTIVSPGNYNDQRWHHVAATLSSTAGTSLYIDGQFVAADPNATTGRNMTGYWLPATVASGLSVPYPPTNAVLTGYLDETAIFNQVLSATQIQHLYRRGANRVRVQARSCAQAGCADNPNWIGPDGTSTSFFSETDNVTANTNTVLATPANLQFANFFGVTIPTNRYFQYRLMLESDDNNLDCWYPGSASTAKSACSPEVLSVNVGSTRFDSSSPIVTNLAGQSYGYLTGFGASYTGCTGSGVTFTLSPDGSNWYYYTGGLWTLANGTQAQSNTLAQLTQAALNNFSFQVGLGSIYFQAFLLSDGVTACALDDVHISGTQLPAYVLMGNVTGLIANGLTIANGADTVYVPADGNFVFDQAVLSGTAYSVSVTQPPGQTCTVNQATGTMANTNVTNVNIVCVNNSYNITGTVTGLTAGSLTFISGGDTKTVSSSGAFNMPTSLAHGQPYNVVVTAQPTALNCNVVNGSGTIANANITNVVVSCATYLKYALNQPAATVIGQSTMGGSSANQGTVAAAGTASGPLGGSFTSAANKVFLPDTANCRVLAYTTLPTANSASAAFEVGQTSLTISTCPPATTSATVLNKPSSVAAYGTGMMIVDTLDHRVLLYTTIPTANAASATGLVGQTTTNANTSGCTPMNMNAPMDAVANGNTLLVADTNNHRVMVWTTLPSTTVNGTAANFVLGQANMYSCNKPASVSATNLTYPQGVWTNGNQLLITDTGANRVLVYNSLQQVVGFAATLQTPDAIIGQTSTTASAAGLAAGFSNPQMAASDGTHVFVVDTGNNRIVVYNAIPSATGVPIDLVFGQSSTVNSSANAGSGVSAYGFSGPRGIGISNNNLIVSDTADNRFLVFISQ